MADTTKTGATTRMRHYRTESIVAGVLFITATGATMASQIIIAPMLGAPDVVGQVTDQRSLFVVGVMLELANALASAGIAIALYPIIWRCVQGLAVAYVGLRLIEASLGACAAIGLLMLLSGTDRALAVALHDWAFLLVLLVFSIGTLILYPVLFKFRLVPVVLSLWGLIGGLMLLVSVVLILFGRIEIGSGTDMVLSLPIWINEMALALWLIFRGFDLHRIPSTHISEGRYGH
ncbi:MAG: DUF4386 domain-containing protein [Yoonia sp.]|nr:DUF4386 domain-containing protein [Yoonia sp.]